MSEEAHKPILIVIAGPNGSGKTSITSKILKHEWLEDAIYINPDIIAQEKFGDWNSVDSIYKSIKFCEDLREKCLIEKKSLIFETVLSRYDKVDYIKRALENGFFVRLFFVCTMSPNINASRITDRVMKGGHDVPIPKIISRYYESIKNSKELTQIVDRAYFYDNSIDNEDAKLLFRFSEGNLAKRYIDDIPEWASIILNTI